MVIELARLDGVVTRWNDDRGFGFISSTLGYGDVFVHISAFPRGHRRPADGEQVSYAIAPGENGKERAVDVRFLRHEVRPERRTRRGPQQGQRSALLQGRRRPSVASIVALVAGAGMLTYIAIAVEFGLFVVGAYAVMSLFCFIAYASDKAAANSGGWRVAESTLHLLGLLGGWPGAIIAQQLLRHKTVKQSFREFFWGTVVLNFAVLVLFVTPAGQQLITAVASFITR